MFFIGKSSMKGPWNPWLTVTPWLCFAKVNIVLSFFDLIYVYIDR